MAIFTFSIVVDIVAFFLNQAVVAYNYVSLCGFVDTRLLYEAFAHLYIFLESTNANVAI